MAQTKRTTRRSAPAGRKSPRPAQRKGSSSPVDEARAALKAAGWEYWHSGGGCMTWHREVGGAILDIGGDTARVSTANSDLTLDTPVGMDVCTEHGHLYSVEFPTLREALTATENGALLPGAEVEVTVTWADGKSDAFATTFPADAQSYAAAVAKRNEERGGRRVTEVCLSAANDEGAPFAKFTF